MDATIELGGDALLVFCGGAVGSGTVPAAPGLTEAKHLSLLKGHRTKSSFSRAPLLLWGLPAACYRATEPAGVFLRSARSRAPHPPQLTDRDEETAGMIHSSHCMFNLLTF